MEKKGFIVALIFALCFSMCVEGLCQNSKNEKAVYNVADKYLNGLTGPTTGTMQQAVKDMNKFASLFDFENLKSSESAPTLGQMSHQYRQIEDREQKKAFNVVFAGNFVPAFQAARFNRVGQVAREDFIIENIKFSEGGKKATAVITDKKKVADYILFFHNKKGKWLIYSWDIKPTPR